MVKSDKICAYVKGIYMVCHKLLIVIGVFFALGSPLSAFGVEVYDMWDVPATGLVLLQVPAAVAGEGVLRVTCDGQAVTSQEVPGAGCCLADLPAALRKSGQAVRVAMTRDASSAKPTGRRVESLVLSNAVCALTFKVGVNGGLPSRVSWASGRTIDRLRWGERVHATTGAFKGSHHFAAGILEDFGAGPLFRHVRVTGSFPLKAAASPDPHAVYDWIFPNDAPGWAYVRMSFADASGETWQQLQVGIAEFPFGTFTRVRTDATKAVNTPREKNEKPQRPTGSRWVALLAGGDFAAVYSSDCCAYVDPGLRLSYLHGSYRAAYGTPWSGESCTRTACFRFGAACEKGPDVLAEAEPLASPRGVRWLDLEKADAPRADERMTFVRGGALTAAVGVQAGRCAALRSVRRAGRVIARGPLPLFVVTLEETKTAKRKTVSSTDAWRAVTTPTEGTWVFTGSAARPAWSDLVVTVKAQPADEGLDWTCTVETASADWACSDIEVGSVELLATGPGMRALYPGCMGNVVTQPCSGAFSRTGSYPSMHCTMPWVCAWDETTREGFYLAGEDPRGTAKRILVQGVGARYALKLGVAQRMAWAPAHPEAASMLSGVVAWRAYRGDWYEAALRYRDFVRARAVWYPAMGPTGRRSTPDWFKRLGYIVRTYGHADSAVKDVQLCQAYFGVPIMAHWYVWHRQPFDNDYPHYFPAKPGFEAGVKRIHELGGYAVPYTNGHLWDMHDRGAEDWQFSAVGAAGACRHHDGSVHTERYRSTETNGAPVVFAAMCPASRVWHDKVSENGHKVVNEAGLDGYYMDQVGAFSTIECRNPAHGHPFGGGSWWSEAYRTLLRDTRARAAKPIFLATEGNAEVNLDSIDACVCWNIEGGEDTVPAFEVCYSGAVTIYCRSYTGAEGWRQMRMKFANLLADGELIGWMPANYCVTPQFNNYLRNCVRFRQRHADWFNLGEMRRPPVLRDPIPVWEETWDIFGGKRLTRMPIVQTGARRILDYDYAPDGRRRWETGRVKKAFVYFTNFSHWETVRSHVTLEEADLGIDLSKACFTRVDEEGRRTPMTRAELAGELVFPANACWGIEIESSGPIAIPKKF